MMIKRISKVLMAITISTVGSWALAWLTTTVYSLILEKLMNISFSGVVFIIVRIILAVCMFLAFWITLINAEHARNKRA